MFAAEDEIHVAFLHSPGMGHIIPLFQFAKHLVLRHRVRVSFLVITTGASTAQNNFLQSASIPPQLQVINIPQPDMADIITEDMLLLTQLCVMTQESLKPLKSILVELNPKALIIDIFTTQAIDVCEELSIPVYTFFTASTILLTFSLYLPTLDSQVEGEFVDLPGPVEVPGCPPIRTNDLLDQVRNRKIEEYRWYLFHVSRMSRVAGIFANTWQDLEPVTLKTLKDNPFFEQISTPPVYPVGPLIKDDDCLTEKDAEIIAWLDNQPTDSVIFINLGSGGTLSSTQLTELAWGLLMSQQRFILVVRKPTDSASGAFFSSGSDENDLSAYFPDGFVEKTRELGLVIPSWAPQVAVLRHESTGAFLSHCGWNSILESLVHGVPMIAWPLYAEQRMNATLLAEEVGVAVKAVAEPGEEVIGREEVERVVRAVMEGGEGKAGIRRRARELKESACKILDKGGVSYDSINRVVDLWKS